MVHSTTASLDYALNLLDCYDEIMRLRAIDILSKIVTLQDTNRQSRNFGLWSWFLEEPLEKMSPPDRNWADFCGRRLIEILLNHQKRLPGPLVVKIDSAISYAAEEIKLRDQSPDYTNIAVMGTFVLVMAGEVLHSKELKAYGFYRLKRFYDYTNREGGFTEYNSPNYARVVIEELNKMRLYFRDTDELKMVNELYYKAWREIAIHYHAKTQQWSGPHSRSYNTILKNETMIHNSVLPADKKVFTLDSYRNVNNLPDSLIKYITDSTSTRFVVDTFKRSKPSFIGTTYLTPSFSLGSINSQDMWEQRRDLVAYWGKKNAVTSVRIRFLHDQKDFSSAIFRGKQLKNKVLGGISFITNGGDTHPSLDKVKNGTIEASNLCIRFQFEGEGLKTIKVDTSMYINGFVNVIANGMHIFVAVPFLTFNNEKGYWSYGNDELGYHLDFICYRGPSRSYNIATMNKAAAAIAFSISNTAEDTLGAVNAAGNESNVNVNWNGLSLTFPIKPYKQ